MGPVAPAPGRVRGLGAEVPPGARVPDFFVVGHAKTGTTALYEMLRQHPQVYLPPVKEPMFLATDLPLRRRAAVGGLPGTLAEYLDLFREATDAQRAGEVSPLYLLSREAPANIAGLNPDARVIALFREPVSFLRSFHLESLQALNEDQADLRRALDLEEERRAGRHIPKGCYRPELLLYSDHVRYREQLERLRGMFPPDRLLVLLYDDFVGDNASTLRRILRFLGVDDSHPLPTLEANPSVAVRSRSLAAATGHLVGGGRPGWGVLKAATKAVVPAPARRWVLRQVVRPLAYSAPPPPDERLVSELKARFRPEVENLAHLLGRDLLTLWGYG